MRKGFDSLSGLVTAQLQMNALSGAMFVFFNKKRNQMKLLLWEGGWFFDVLQTTGKRNV